MQLLPESSRGAPTLEDLAALNREIAALVRAGLPLEEGLRQIAADNRRGPGKIAARLESETSAGKSLAEAIAAQGSALPPVYRTVVEAGVKAGRLPAALEGFADSAARIAELRRICAQAAIYPLIVFVLGVTMLLTIAAIALPTYRWVDIDDRIWAMPLALSRRTARRWAMGVTGVTLGLAALWWWKTASAHAAPDRQGWLRWIPGASRTAKFGAQANFAEMLGLMLSNGVPLVEALPLAGEASGRASLRQTAAELAVRLAGGQPLSSQMDTARGLPPLVRTALLGSASEGGLIAGLARASTVYRERAAAWISDLAVIVPVTATLVVGVFIVGLYAFLLLQPYIATLKAIAMWY